MNRQVFSLAKAVLAPKQGVKINSIGESYIFLFCIKKFEKTLAFNINLAILKISLR